MRTSVLFAAAVVIVAVVASAGVRPARADLATIESTCRAARAADRVVPSIFCKHRLSAHPGAADADVSGLARIAAALGAGNADAARAEAGRLLLERGGDLRHRGALEECARLFGAIRAAFAAAEEALAARRYAVVREELAGVTELGHDCHAGVDRASPLMDYSVNNTLYAHMCMAIAGLVNVR